MKPPRATVAAEVPAGTVQITVTARTTDVATTIMEPINALAQPVSVVPPVVIPIQVTWDKPCQAVMVTNVTAQLHFTKATLYLSVATARLCAFASTIFSVRLSRLRLVSVGV